MQKKQQRVSIPILARTTPPPGSSSSTRPRMAAAAILLSLLAPHHITQNTIVDQEQGGCERDCYAPKQPTSCAIWGPIDPGPIGLLRCRYVHRGPDNVCRNFAYLRTYEPEDTAFTHVHVASALLVCPSLDVPAPCPSFVWCVSLACVAPYIFPLSPVAKHHGVA
ncbi:hypothetical protein CORC01_10718 [Colletotrichum orchidophilum]|uniref:Uncharacterized protein n=1 Tax=Colletotrichum orchidophilum TaxID=1209926 RepID=A0A1G4AY30_9PEZI|nr:uncharacterized protein CORC01_10718 [Colletotrichum orchidophilum]OHE94026.1 hypothetical protein CORC01_10718 [Colletotrichum orchidophilum]